MFPIVCFDRMRNQDANALLEAWGHSQGGCRRPFHVESFGLFLGASCVSVAVSASTPRPTCGGYRRKDVVELARLCTAPGANWATRVCLRLWREVAPAEWALTQWPVIACVSYQDAVKHTGNVYRFDGWKKVADTRGGVSGPNGGHQPSKKYNAKAVWAWDLRSSA